MSKDRHLLSRSTRKYDNVNDHHRGWHEERPVAARAAEGGRRAAWAARRAPVRFTGFPTIWAQEIKDIELRHVGVSYSVVKAIGDQASKDLGFKVTMQNLDTSAAINRFITQPDSVDIADVEGWQAKLATKRGVLQGIEVKKIKEFDNILPIFTKGELEGHKIPRQGISPYEAMYIAKPTDTDLHDGVADWMTFLPQVYNADSIGYRPDLVGHEVTEWKELHRPEVQGQSRDPRRAGDRHHGRGAVLRERRPHQARQQRQHDQEGDRLHGSEKLIELKKSGHFRATWTTFDQSVQLMAAGEVIIQSMWSPAVAAVRVKEHSVRLRAGEREERQGRLSRLVQRHGIDEASERQEARCCLRVL
jgi:putative spermidine/putrescine transport system substrate-binding protein